MHETLELAREMAPSVGDVVAFPGSNAATSRDLSLSAADLVRNISSILEVLVSSALERRTAAEFTAVRSELFPKYFEGVLAYSNLVKIVVPPLVLERLAAQSLSEMDATFRDKGTESRIHLRQTLRS